jgi:hypothetical protein
MSEVLEDLAGQIMSRLDATLSQVKKDTLNLETIEVICGNVNEHLFNSLSAAASKETFQEKFESLSSSIQAISQAIGNEPQKVRGQRRELELKCTVYNEMLDLIRSSKPPTPPVEEPIPAVVESEPEYMNLSALGSKPGKDE